MKNTNKEVTIYDLARELNLSPATVSRALQGHPGISKKTKKRIFDLADQKAYRTNPFASNLRNQKTRTIGVLVHELKGNFITSVLAGIEKITAKEKYDIIIAHSSESVEKESKNAANLFNKRIDGLIASLSFDTANLDHFDPFFKKGVPVIFFDRVEEELKKTVVIIDNENCGYIATRHLIEQSCKRIVHVTSALNRNVYAHRYQGYKKALLENGLSFDESMLVMGDLSQKSGIDAAAKIMGMRPFPDGIFITNDLVAAFCIRTLKDNGFRIPADIAVVGFNNDAIGELIEPALTTIDYPGEDMGEIAATSLINHLKGVSNLSHTNTIIVHSGLIIRKSSLRIGDSAIIKV